MSLLISLLACAAQAGPTLYEVEGQAVNSGFGNALADIADVDGDGVRDWLGGSSRYASSTGDPVLVSGATGTVLHSFSTPVFGEAVADAGDVNGDGVTDLYFGDIFTGTPIKSGRAWVFSGAAPYQQLLSFNGTQADQYLGGAGAGLGDVNGDGYSDVAIGSWGAHTSEPFAGKLEVYSGFDGSLLYTINGEIDHGYFGEAVTMIPDLDGDGVNEFAVGEFGADSLGYNTGAVTLYSGASGTQMHRWEGASGNSRFGDDISHAGDIDGDGVADIIVGAYFGSSNGEAFVYSGADYSEIYHFRGYEADEVFGRAVDGAGDTNGDGRDDIIIGSGHYYVAGGYTGFVRVYSGKDGSMLQDFRDGSATARLGSGVAGLGDIDGDGLSDMIVGAQDETTAGGTKSGTVFAFSGAREGILFEITELAAGESPTVRLTGCDPSSSAIFAWSLIGPGPTSTPLGLVSLSAPFEQTPLVACDASGTAELTLGALPLSAELLPVWAQAGELYAAGGGQLSLPLELRVQ